MRFSETGIAGAFIVDVEPARDERGLFARTFCAHEFSSRGLPSRFVQASTSFNARRGTLRGMHWQAEPKPEGKLVRCTRGAIYDVILDLRRDSATYLAWKSFELSAEDRRAIYIPPGLAHGFQALQDGSEVLYEMTESYVAELSRGVRWNDPAFRIAWPIASPVLSARDAAYPDWQP
jgi:dTDP-4-dehydrorhamnose 3,5-epimerase